MASYSLRAGDDCCCGVDPTCPPRMLTLHIAGTDLDVSITCEDACDDCFNDGISPSVECWPDTGTMPDDAGTPRRWTSTGLSCNVGAMALECNGGNVALVFTSSACTPITVPTTLVTLQNSPFMVVFTTSSNWFGYCGYDGDTGDCTTERTVTVTITEP